MSFHVFISTAEISGDIHGSHVVKILNKLHPRQFIFSGLGGEHMRSAGVNILYDISTQSSIGLQEGIRFAFSSFGILKQTKKWIKNNSIDLFLAIDGQGRNLFLGRSIQKLGIKTAYFFPPLAFLWGSWNVPKLLAYDLLICPFTPNAQYLERKGAKVIRTGHPFSTYPKSIDKKKFKKFFGLDPRKKVLALFPGSRYQEVEKLTGVFAKTADKLFRRDENLQILLALSHSSYRPIIENQIALAGVNVPIKIITEKDRSKDVLKAADFLLAASGTVTLQAAFFYLPTAIAYRISPLSTWIGSKFLKRLLFGMPNILAGEEIFKEFLNSECNPENLTNYIESILFNPQGHKLVVNKITDLVERIRVPNHEKILGNAIYNLVSGKQTTV